MTSTPLPGARAGRDPARAIKRGPRRLPPEVIAATQRDRLFDGLVHTVAQKGYAGARVTDICQAAGVTRPVFYALFAGKEEAFLAAYRHGTAVLLRLMDEAYAAGEDWRSGVRAALRVLLDVLAAVPAFAAMAIVEIDGAGPSARRARDELLGDFHRYFAEAPWPPPERAAGQPGRDAEQAGREFGQAGRDAERAGRDVAAERRELISSVVGGLQSTIYRYVAAGRAADLGDTLPILAYFTVAPFLGGETAAAELCNAPHIERASVPCAPLDQAPTGR